MKKILFIAPSCFPVTSAEAIVNYNLLKVLKNAGYIIDVVSRSHPNQIYPDSTITGDISLNSINIIPTDTKRSLSNYWKHLLAYTKFGITYSGAHWAYTALPIVKSLLSKTKYDVVITKDLPSELLGIYIKKKYGIKWIATWNDPYPVCKYPYPYGKGVDAQLPFGQKKLVKYMNKYVDIHIFPSERLKNYMLKYLDVPKEKTIVVPHVVLPETNINASSNGYINLIHSGSLKYPRNPECLLKAYSKFREDYPNAKIKLDFLGYNQNVSDIAKEIGIEKYIKILKPVNYDEALKIVSSYQIALIIEAPCEEGIFLPTKVGDYLKCGLNILAISPSKGVLNDLYCSGKIKYFADCQNVDDIYNELVKIWDDYTNRKQDKLGIPFEFSPNYINKQYQRII